MIETLESFVGVGQLGRIQMEALKMDFKRDSSSLEMAGLQGEFPKGWDRGHFPETKALVEDFARDRGKKVTGVMVNRLPAHSQVPVHQDPGTAERWHFPINTSTNVYWWDEENEFRHFPAAMWSGPVPYHLHHQVTNQSPYERVHIVVDIE